MSFLRRHRTALVGAAGLAVGWVLASMVLENLFGGSPLPWWLGVVIGAVYVGIGVFRGPPEERREKAGRR